MKRLPFSYALRNLGRNLLRLIVAIGGSAIVVLLVLAAGSFVRGMQQTLTRPATLHQNIILLGAGSEEAIERSEVKAAVPGIATASISGLRTEHGVAYVSPEIHSALPLRLQAGGQQELPAVLRGVRPVAALVHSEVELVDGRWPEDGADELLVGALASTRLGVDAARLAIGQTLFFDDRDWTIVGQFRAPGTVLEAEIWLPLVDLQIATNRESSLSCVIVTLGSASFVDVDLFAKSRLDLELAAISEADYYASIATFYGPIRVMILVTALLIAGGALLGGLNTMYAAFAARIREVGMLQTLGYSRSAVVLSLVEESTFAAACGGLLGAALGWWLLDGVAVRFSMGAFALQIDGVVMGAALLSGLLVGMIGALPPALRCLRMPIAEALQAH